MNTKRIYRKKSNTPRRFLSLLLSAGILISGIPGKPAKAEETKSVETSYVILTDNTKTAKEVVKEFDGEKIENNTKLVEVDMTRAEARKLEKDNDVIYVEKNITLTASLEDTEAEDNQENLSDIEETLEIPNLEKLQWNRQAVGVTTSAEVTDTPDETEPTDNLDKDKILLPDSTDISNKVKIEILDSGVSAGGDTYIEEYVDLTREISEEGYNPLFADDNGHGTAMAGVIGAQNNDEGIKGINPNAGIYSVKALDSDNAAPLSRIIKGIYWGIENDMDIINMSFGTPADSEILHKAVRDAYVHGILVVAAAGNTAHQEVQYPAAYPEAIAVGSVNEAGELAKYTSIGTELELLAPGENVVSEDSLAGLTVVSGTSIATAQVTAVASLLMQNHPQKSGKFIRSLLRKSAKKINLDAQTTAGLIDYNYAEKIYEEFALSYTDTDITEIESQNIEPVGDYSAEAEQMVQGLWDAKILRTFGLQKSILWYSLSTKMWN